MQLPPENGRLDGRQRLGPPYWAAWVGPLSCWWVRTAVSFLADSAGWIHAHIQHYQLEGRGQCLQVCRTRENHPGSPVLCDGRLKKSSSSRVLGVLSWTVEMLHRGSALKQEQRILSLADQICLQWHQWHLLPVPLDIFVHKNNFSKGWNNVQVCCWESTITILNQLPNKAWVLLYAFSFTLSIPMPF